MLRTLPALAFALVVAAASTAEAQASTDLAGMWIADRDLEIVLWLSLDATGDAFGCSLGEGGDFNTYTEARVSLSGAQLDVTVDANADEGVDAQSARFDFDAAAGTLTLRAISPARRGVRAGLVLTRRDALDRWMRSNMIDLAHEDDGRGYTDDDIRFYVGLVDAVREAALASGRAAALQDQVQSEALLFVADQVFRERRPRTCRPRRARTCAAAYERARSLTRALIERAGTTSLADVDLPPLDPTQPPPAGVSACATVTVTDSDGSTTVRREPSSRASALGTAPHGARLTVVERRGRWLRVGGSTPGWVYESNVTCAGL